MCMAMARLLLYSVFIGSFVGATVVPPIIFVPGDGGSQIQAKLNKPSTVHYVCTQKTDTFFDLWLNMELMAPYFIDCWIDNMRLIYNKTTRKTSNNEGVETRIPGFGNSETVEWLDSSHRYLTGYFKDIANALIPLGYERGTTIRGAPFDFRKAPNELGDYFLQLRKLVEHTHQTTGQKVVFVAHSMGSPVLHVFLNQQSQHWKDKHIRAFVSLAGAWGGVIESMKVFTSGDNLGIYVLPSKSLREEQRCPSLAFLLPNPEIWGPDYILAQTPTANYTTANLNDFFRDLNFPDGFEMYLDTKDFLTNAPAPGVEVHCLHGVGVPTLERMNFAAGKFPDSPIVKNGDGDGTVNLLSAQRCLQWSNTSQRHQVYHETYKGVDHMAILRNEEPINYIVNVINKITAENQWELDMINGLKKLTRGEENKIQASIKEDIDTKNDIKLEKSIEELVVEVEKRMHKN